MNNENNSLIIIEKTGILDDVNFGLISKIDKELTEGFNNQIMFRPRYLMEVSVLDDVKFPTIDSKYWQANLERDVHYQNLVWLSFNYKEQQADIEIKKARIDELLQNDTILSKAKANKFKIQVEQMQTELMLKKKEAIERVREVINWTDIMHKFESKLEFSKDNPEEHMPKSYPLRFARQKAIIEQVGASDMNGAMNILGLCETSFNNPKTIKLMEQEKKLLKNNR